MKFTSLLLAVACAVGFSSCCCQTQPMPKLRPFPKDCKVTTPAPATTPEAPVKVFQGKGK
ncbi:MAG: hypothetical protein MJ051_00975 [Akkermansia sp.]|nr:hypothetical protein [Akkermansia sp.]